MKETKVTLAQNTTLATTSGEIFFDAECRFCMATRRRWGSIFERRGFAWVPMQTPGTAARLEVTEDQLQATMWLRLPNGGKSSGADAWGVLMRSVWWLWPLGLVSWLPGFRAIARAVYDWIARHRHCLAPRELK